MIDQEGYAELRARWPFLFHRVWRHVDQLDVTVQSILEHGLERTHSTEDGYWTSREGHVYFGRTKAVAGMRSGLVCPSRLIRIDTAFLEPTKINPDEDHFLTHNFIDDPKAARNERACRRFGVPWPPSKWLWEWARYLSIPFVTLGEWAEAVELGDDPRQTRYSLACGTVAYAGVVPPAALSVVADAL